MAKRSVVTVLLALLLAANLLACAGRAFQRARSEDTAAAYADFLREHPGSRHAQEARERSALVRVRANPTPEAYREFLARHPESPLLSELRAIVEDAFLLRARAAGSVGAYSRFLEEFGDGSHAARARGNAAYLEASGFGGEPRALAAFASEYPASDFAAEARRSADSLELRDGTAIRRVGLEIGIAPGTPGAERLGRVFAERAHAAYRAAGVELVPVAADAASPPVRLRILHREQEVRTSLDGSQVTSPGIQATTQIALIRAGEERPLWSEEFRFHTFAGARREDTSILFGPGTQPYWEGFFVPAPRWDANAALRTPRSFAKPPVAVDATPTHAYVLFGDGDFQVFELGNPEEPLLVAEHRRSRDLTQWRDLRVFGNRVVTFGDDGIELVELGAEGPQRVAVWERGSVGSIIAVEPADGGFVAAGKRGLLLLPGTGGAPERLIDREVLGLASVGGRLVFSDGTSLYVSTPALLRERRVEAELRLGTGFGPERVRVRGETAVVLGRRGLVRVALQPPSAPRLLSRIETTEVGAIRDATLVRGRLFLLGERGLQVADPRGEAVVDTAPVAVETRLDASGRHLVVIGGKAMQVVDTTPFVLSRSGASPAALEP